MTPASITQTATGALARPGQNQGGDDATGRGGQFDAVLADVAQDAEPVASADAASDGVLPVPVEPALPLGLGNAQATSPQPSTALSAQRAGRQDVRALLAQVSGGSPASLVSAVAATGIAALTSAPTGNSAHSDPQTKDTATLATSEAAPDTANQLAAAFLPVHAALVAPTAVPGHTNVAPTATGTPAATAVLAAPLSVEAAPTSATASPFIDVEIAGAVATHPAPATAIMAGATSTPALSATIVDAAGHLAPASFGVGAHSSTKASAGPSGRAAAPAANGGRVPTDVEASTTVEAAGATVDPVSPVTASKASGDAHATAEDAPSAATRTRDASAQPDTALPEGTIRTIASAVASLADDAADAPATAPAAQAAPAAASVAPARSLTLQLSPGTLGAVTVHLHMTGGGLGVRLAVENDTALGAISRARDELGAAIGDTGTRLDSLIIQSAPASATAGSNDTTRSQGDAPAGSGGFANDSGSRGGGGSSRDTRQGGSAPARPPAAAAGDRGDDGVYV